VCTSLNDGVSLGARVSEFGNGRAPLPPPAQRSDDLARPVDANRATL